MFFARRTHQLLIIGLSVLSLSCELGAETPADVDATSLFAADAQPASSSGSHGDAGADGVDASSAPRGEGADATAAAARDAGVPDAQRDTGGSAPLDAASELRDAEPARDAARPLDAASTEELCPDGFARGDASLALTRVAPFAPSPEGVTVCANGEVFVAVDGTDEIRRVPLDGGAPELYASLTGFQPAGMDCDERGRLFVASYSRRDGSPNPPILMVAAKGASAVSLPAPGDAGVGALNGIEAVEGVGVFASDTTNGTLLRARELPDGGFETTVAAKDLSAANGLMYAASTRRLYLTANLLPPSVFSFAVGSDGALTDRREEATGSLLSPLYDGVAVDAAGTLYVADYLGGAVLRARDRVAIAKLSDPASFAFRGGTLLITSYHLGDAKAEGGLYALSLGVCGPGKSY
jgi:hypothetical protein